MAVKRPNSKRNLDMAIRRLGADDESYVRNRTIIANAIVGQLLSDAVVKGGAALKIRFGDASTRATTDLDAARAVSEDIFADDFAERLAQGWEGFTGRLLKMPRSHPEGVPESYVMQPYEIKLSYLGASWCTVEFELGHNEIGDADEGELVRSADAAVLLANMGFPEPAPVPLMSLAYQIAQKLHGVSEPRSQRAHDLVDLQIIVRRGAVDYAHTRTVCERLFAYRKKQLWPPTVVASEGWPSLYAAAAQGVEVAPSVEDAVVWANELIVRIAEAQ